MDFSEKEEDDGELLINSHKLQSLIKFEKYIKQNLLSHASWY